MKPLILAVLVLLLGTTSTLAQKPLVAGSRHPQPAQAANYEQRQGGEYIADAVEITLPFLGTGTTVGHLDDFDVSCPYSGSISPDVFYTFVAAAAVELVRVDLCGSLYDTKTYILDESMQEVACNDDFYFDDDCGIYVSLIEGAMVTPGQRYYVAIDGYGGDAGEYFVAIEGACLPPPCLDAECPPDGLAEFEPPLIEGYHDTFNSGCRVDPPAFQELTMPPGTDQFTFCGRTGWYRDAGQITRDEDWFIMTAAGPEVVVETSSSHYLSTKCEVLVLQDCQDVSLLPYVMGVCDAGVIEIPTQAGQLVYLRVMPVQEEQPECALHEDLYTLKISGISGSVVNTDPLTWDALKSCFR